MLLGLCWFMLRCVWLLLCGVVYCLSLLRFVCGFVCAFGGVVVICLLVVINIVCLYSCYLLVCCVCMIVISVTMVFLFECCLFNSVVVLRFIGVMNFAVVGFYVLWFTPCLFLG